MAGPLNFSAPDVGAIVRGYQPTTLENLVQAAGQFPQQQEQAAAAKLQQQLGSQQVQANKQAMQMNDQEMDAQKMQMDAAQKQMQQQQLSWYGTYLMNNKSQAANPALVSQFKNLAAGMGLDANAYLNSDGTSINLEMFKQDMPQEEYSRLMMLPKNMRVGQLNIDKQTMRIGSDSMQRLLNDPPQIDPMTQANLSKITAAAAASATEATEHLAQANKANVDANLAPLLAQANVTRAQAALSQAGAAWARVEQMQQQNALGSGTTLITQLSQDVNTADRALNDAQSQMGTLFKAYKLDPKDPNAQQNLLNAIGDKYKNDPKSYQAALDQVNKIQGGITAGQAQVTQLRDRVGSVLPYVQNQGQRAYLQSILTSTSSGTATLEPATTPKKAPNYPTAPPGTKFSTYKTVNGVRYGQTANGTIYKVPPDDSQARADARNPLISGPSAMAQP